MPTSSLLLFILFVLLCGFCPTVRGFEGSLLQGPTIHLDNGSVVGRADEDNLTHSFRGLQYAKPPVGALRFQKPQAIDTYTGIIDATSFGSACHNFTNGVIDPSTMQPWVSQEIKAYIRIFNHYAPGVTFSEDCLNLDVIVPAQTSPNKKLPVAVYIPFSAFQFGGSTSVDGRKMVKRSIELGEPIIFVGLNHRMGPLGFLPGQEALDHRIGNLGLRDQREALRWIKSYISRFGGDQGRVTLVGLSAGGVSAATQMVANSGDSEGLFHGIWAESGALQPVAWINDSRAQATYSTFVKGVCGVDVDVNNALPCLRNAPVAAMIEATKLLDGWQPGPLVDGDFIEDYPQHMHYRGVVAHVPVVAGNANEEGSLFATIISANFTSTATGVQSLVRNYYYPYIGDTDMDALVHEMYPDDPELGVPYNTGENYQHVKGWKRTASLLGDIAVDAVRRRFVHTHSIKRFNDTWSYIYRRYNITGYGCAHGSEIVNIYSGGDMADRLIWFVNTFNPNRDTATVEWPKYKYVTPTTLQFDPPKPTLLEFSGTNTLRLVPDTYREHALELVMRLNLENTWTL